MSLFAPFPFCLNAMVWTSKPQAPFDKVEPLVYKYSVSLMAADPAGTIETWCVRRDSVRDRWDCDCDDIRSRQGQIVSLRRVVISA